MNNNIIMNMKELELEENSDVEQEIHSDDDLCDENEIKRQFPICELLGDEQISNDKYILHITGTNDSNPNIGVALADDSFQVFNLNNTQLQSSATLRGNTGPIIDCKFSQDNRNLVYTCSSDGFIKIWDLRTQTTVNTFVDTTCTGDEKKTFNSFDISPNGKLLTAGTDLFGGDAFILFWDVRNVKLLGGYWESHTDDITQVKFDPTDSNKLISGSTDGLINIYDLSQSDEDDALIDSLNTESSVEKLQWYKEDNNDYITCITHTADVQLWKTEDAEPSYHFRRSQVAQEIMRKSENYIYVVNTHEAKNSLLILAGSNVNDGECFRSLQCSKGTLHPGISFPNNKQRVRASYFNKHSNILLTGGEKGILNVWKADLPEVERLKRK
ncbi:WD repeat-containing protein 89 [Aethina tumida]|uniref:WD repeat-containing protein 89 n=1 Tax=Aethina tumida TaxID=116153 RepID=UPI002148E87A|nr:WD repeat-containing protein 89 [Aethina tumida]